MCERVQVYDEDLKPGSKATKRFLGRRIRRGDWALAWLLLECYACTEA